MPLLIKRFIYAGRGLRYVLQRERSFRLQLLLLAIALVVGWWLGFSLPEFALLLTLATLVLTLEVSNTVNERLLDLLEPRLSLHVAFLKDVQAATVFLAAIASLVVGLLLVVEHW